MENDDKKSDVEEKIDEAKLAVESGQSVSQNAKHLIHCLTVIGQIE